MLIFLFLFYFIFTFLFSVAAGCIYSPWEIMRYLSFGNLNYLSEYYLWKFYPLTYKFHDFLFLYSQNNCSNKAYTIVSMHRIFIFHSGIKERRCCFHLLAAMNRVAVTMTPHEYLWVRAVTLLGICQRVVQLSYVAN